MKSKYGIALLSIVVCLSAQCVEASWLSKFKNVFNTSNNQSLKEVLSSSNLGSQVLSNSEIILGLKEALQAGISAAVSKLGVENGFSEDPNVHIALPGALSKLNSALALVGMSSMTEELELKINRAAEIATSASKELFIKSVSQMSISYAKNILTGSDNSATEYFRNSIGADLQSAMSPIVSNAISSSGAIQSYDSAMSKYSQIPFMPDIKANLNSYVVDKAMDGIFYYVAKEEASIRENPAARTTDLLQKVFSQ